MATVQGAARFVGNGLFEFYGAPPFQDVAIPADRLLKMRAPWPMAAGISAAEPFNSGPPGADPVVLALQKAYVAQWGPGAH